VYRLPLRIADIQDSSGAGRERVGFVRPQRRRANVSSSLEIMLQIRESRVHLVDSLTSTTGQSPVKIVQSDPSPITTVPMSLLRISFFAVVFLTLSGESKSIKRDKKMLKVSNIFLASVCLLLFFCFLCYPLLLRLPSTLSGRSHGLPSGPRVPLLLFDLIWLVPATICIGRWLRESFPVKEKNWSMPTY
jgi:hypothetical protein